MVIEDEAIWATQKDISEIFGKSKSTISEHLSNIFKEDELDEDSVVRNFRTTAEDGKSYKTLQPNTQHYRNHCSPQKSFTAAYLASIASSS